MELTRLAAVVAAAALGGAVNSIAGGGTLLTFPSLIALGIPPIVANATSTIALWPGTLSSMYGYRDALRGAGRWAVAFAVPSLAGGGVGAWLLLNTSAERFAGLAPWLVLGATALFAAQGVLRRHVHPHEAAARIPTRFLVYQFLVGIYGGYFGAGIGILMLAVLGMMGLRDIHQMNGLKNWGGSCMNFVAAATFAFTDLVNWPVALAMAGGSIAGGYVASRVAQRVPQVVVRRAVLAIGLASGAALLLTRSADAQPAPTVPTAVAFVDAHVHLNDPAMQRALMDAHGLPLAFAFWGAHSDNASVAAAAREDPRIVPWASISPERREYRARWIRNDTTLLGELDRALGTGAYRGIGEISVVHFESAGFPEADFDVLGPMMRGIMALAERHRVPVMVHCEVTRLRELDSLLVAFPRVTVVWAHGGYTPLVLARRMLARHPNLVYELSARTWSRHPRSPDYTVFRDDARVWPEWLALIEANAMRFLVGTDASHRDAADDRRKIERVRLLLAQLTPATRAAVAEGNARRLVAAPSRASEP